MENSYYNSTRNEILKRLQYINEKKYVDFFRESAPFMMSLYLTYFGLTEDIMIKRDSKDFNINTRFTKFVDEEYLKKIFPKEIPIEYTKKEADGNSKEWILSTIRNGIFHNGPEINYKDKKIIVKNDGFLNSIECAIPFEWFVNFINQDILRYIQLDNYTYYLFTPPFKPNKEKHLGTYNDINNYIEKELHGIVLNISLKQSSNDLTKIEREEFISFSDKLSTKFYNQFYRDENTAVDKEFELIKEKTELRLTTEKSTLSNSEYEKVLYFEMFKEIFTNNFNKKYPDYIISITPFENKDYAESLFKRGKDRVQFFKYERPQFQGSSLVHLLKDKFNHDKVDYISKIYDLCCLYNFCSKKVTTEYNTDKYMKKIVNSKYSTNKRAIEEEYINVVKKELEKKGIKLTYDKQITYHIINSMHIYKDDIHKRCLELTNNYNSEKDSEEYNQYIEETLKKEFPNYYERERKKYIENDMPADQLLEIINTHDLYALNNAKGIFIQHRDAIIEALLYVLGINLYVMNKETHFKDLTNEEYKFMDKLNFKGYSHDLYKENISKYKEKRKSLIKSKKRITESIKGLQIAISKITNADILKKKKENLIKLTSELISINNSIKCYEAIIDNTEVIEIDDKELQESSNIQTANIIRNCFAHCDRIHITGRDKNGETLITLTDYDNDGIISGIVKTDLTSLISFLNNEIFKKEVEKNTNTQALINKK